MQKLAWIALLVLLPHSAHATDWDRALDDMEIFEEVLTNMEADVNEQVTDADINDAEELFPLVEGEDDTAQDISMSDTHITIRVNGVPVVLQDVPQGAWFAPYVRDVADRNLVSGYKDSAGRPTGDFGPADNVTIEQLAKMAIEAAQVDLFACDNELLNEATIDRWSERYIRCAEDLGWAVFSDGTVDPVRPATRAEVVVTVLQAFGARIGPRSGTVFTDVNTATPYGAAIETAANDSVVAGYSDASGTPTGEFGPEDPVTRAATAKIFSLSFQVYNQN